MPSYLQLLYRKTLLDIARELTQAQQSELKFLCSGEVPASYREGSSMLTFFEKLEQDCFISCESLEYLRQLLDAIKRSDLIESKVGPFEFKRELIFVLEAYDVIKKNSGSRMMDRRSTKVAKILVEEAEGKISLSDLLKKIDEAGADIFQIVDKFIDLTVAKKPKTWATVAMMVIFGAEVVVCATGLERESRLKEVIQTLGKHLMQWISSEEGWNHFYTFIENHHQMSQCKDSMSHVMDEALEEIVQQFEVSKLFYQT